MDSSALRSDCADVHADLVLHCPHLSGGPSLHDRSYILITDHLASLETMDEDQLKSRWREEIKAFKSRGDNQSIVIVIDALDQVSYIFIK